MGHHMKRKPGTDVDIHLGQGAFICEKCCVPAVCLVQKMRQKSAPQRYLVLCPICHVGLRIVALRSHSIHMPMPKGACVYDTVPHDCDGRCRALGDGEKTIEELVNDMRDLADAIEYRMGKKRRGR